MVAEARLLRTLPPVFPLTCSPGKRRAAGRGGGVNRLAIWVPRPFACLDHKPGGGEISKTPTWNTRKSGSKESGGKQPVRGQPGL